MLFNGSDDSVNSRLPENRGSITFPRPWSNDRAPKPKATGMTETDEGHGNLVESSV
jgi:hypothetical protein